MAMNFNRPAGAPTTAVAAKPETALMEVQPYDTSFISAANPAFTMRRKHRSGPIMPV